MQNAHLGEGAFCVTIRLVKSERIVTLSNSQNNTSLSSLEQTQLSEYESTIERGLNAFIDVGNALLAIRDDKLYRERYITFDDYCRERWNIARAHAYRLMDSAQVIGNLSPIGDTIPANEAQARPLAKLRDESGVMDVELQKQVWQEAVATARDDNVTASHVEQVARKISWGKTGMVYWAHNTLTQYADISEINESHEETK